MHMKTIKHLSVITLYIFFLFACEKDDYDFGNIVSPTNLIVTAELQGVDSDNLFGDGSGIVTFSATATDAITYRFITNGVESLAPSGIFTTTFTNVGTNSYDVVVIASGIAGETTQTNITVDVLYTFEPPADLVNSLISGSWRVMAEESGHIGVHNPESFHDGVTSFPEWYSATPFQQLSTGLYDDRIIFHPDGTAEFIAQGTIFGNAQALESDFNGSQGLSPNEFGEHAYYPIDDFVFNWNIYENDDGYLVLNFTGNGFAGSYQGGDGQYVITHRNPDSSVIYLKTIALDTNAWYAKITNQE